MSKKPDDIPAGDNVEWQGALEVVGRLAAARNALETDRNGTASPLARPVFGRRQRTGEANPGAIEPPLPASDELNRDLEEIAVAARKLRRAEPTLTMSAGPVRESVPTRTPNVVWGLVALIWITTTVVVVGMIAAIVRFL